MQVSFRTIQLTDGKKRVNGALRARAAVRPALRQGSAFLLGLAGGWAVLYGALMPFGLGLTLGFAEDCFAVGAAGAALGVLAIIPVFLVCYACVYRLCKPPTLQRMEYIEASMFLKFGGFLLALLGIVLFVWHGVFSLRHALPSEVGRELSVTAAWGLMAGSAIYLWIAELTTEYCQRNREGAVIHREHFKRSGG